MKWWARIQTLAIAVFLAVAKKRRVVEALGITVLLAGIVVLTLGFADAWAPEVSTPHCFSSFIKSQFPKWLGCAMAAHENLAGGLIAVAGASLAAWIAWHAIMHQINAEADCAYEALQIQLQPVIAMLDAYWRVVDAAIKRKLWRRNGGVLLRVLHPPPEELYKSIDQDLASGLDPVRR